MDKYSIGKDAGIVWSILSNGQRWSYDKLKEKAGLSDRDLNAAIGWLAREDKIFFETDQNNVDYLYLFTNIYY